MKIRTKIGFVLGLSISLVTVSISASWFIFEKNRIQKTLEDQLQSQLDMWAAVCREAKLSQNDLALLNYLHVLKKTAGLAFAYSVNQNGEITAHTDSRFILRPLQEFRGQTSMQGVLVLEKNTGLNGEGDRAVLGFNKAYMDQLVAQATRSILRQVLTVGILAAIFGFLMAWILSLYLAKQIVALYYAAERLGAGDFKTRADIVSSDELGGLAQRFNEMAQKLTNLNEIKDNLVAIVSHDLRSPLAGILMYAEYMIEETNNGLSVKQIRMLRVIISNVTQLTVFIKNILDNAKIKDGKMQYMFKPCRLSDMVLPVLQLFGTTAELRKIGLTASFPENLPFVVADTERLEQVFSNLISNALKFTPDGGRITISAKPAGSALEVLVADTGKGIPDKDLERIFEKFEQSDVAGQKSSKLRGAGLGLSIARETIERHGGRIWAESQVGQGTTFHFLLPLAKEPISRPSNAGSEGVAHG